MDWALDYYTKQSETFARAVVTESHRAIAARLHGWCAADDRCRAILELGAGMGGVAAALGDLGYDVCAVEFNPADAALARELAAESRPGTLRIVEADFFTVDLEARFDFVFYWDGFGIGTDDDQRRLLRRVASEWLADGGRVFLDVFSPWNWARRDGDTMTYTARDGAIWRRTIEFDTDASRFIDHWEPEVGGGEHRSQTIRCYSLDELRSLVDGTGLAVASFLGMDGRTLDETSGDDARYLSETNGFYAMLTGAEQ